PGDVLEIKSSELFINNQPAFKPEGMQYSYLVQTNGTGFRQEKLLEHDITEVSGTQMQNVFEMHLTDDNLERVKSLPNVLKVERYVKQKGYYNDSRYGKNLIWPNTDTTTWTEDNFG